MRFLILIAGTMLFAIMALSTIRFWGQGQVYKEFKSPYFSSGEKDRRGASEIIVPWEHSDLVKDKSAIILWVDVYRTKKELLLVRPWMERNKSYKDLEQVASPSRPLLSELLSQNPQSRFVINCNVNVDNIHHQLVQVIEAAKSTDRVLLQSDYNTILTSAKELAPMMVFGSTPADLTRIKTFDSMWLLPAAPFKGDVLFVNLKYRNRDTIDRNIVTEMKHRFKKIFIGPLANAEEVQQATELGADGLFVQDPFLIFKK